MTEDSSEKVTNAHLGQSQTEGRGLWHWRRPGGSSSHGRTRSKVFLERDSLLTQMLQVKDIQGIYNIFLAFIINLTVYTVLSDLLTTGEINLGFQNFKSVFGKWDQTFGLVLWLHLCSFSLYPVFKIWARSHQKGFPKLTHGLFILYILAFGSLFMYVPILFHAQQKFPISSAAIIVMEKIRLFMKMWAFLRTNIPRALGGSDPDEYGRVKKMEGDEAIPINQQGDDGPTFQKYLYFLFAPTLIYRDSYPRSPKIRWSFVLQNVIELLVAVYAYNLVQEACGYTLFKDFGLPGHRMTSKDLLNAFFKEMIPGGLGFLFGFFILLHTTQNIFGEILRFGDRGFYEDWWNSCSYPSFYRKWNLPVHDFLYNYLYEDAKWLCRGSKTLSAFVVIIISALVHEYVLAFALQFLYPIHFMEFAVVGGFLFTIRFSDSLGNLFILWSLITGPAIMLFFYSIEYFARLNGCPPAVEDPFLDFMVPRSWSCGGVQWS